MPRTEPAPKAPQAARSRKGAATRARLLESAKAVFEKTGFLEARITDIADGAGISHGTFYHYFDGKEEIFREVAAAQEALLTEHDEHDERGAEQSAERAERSEYDRILRANRRYLERYRDNGRIMGVIEEVSRYDPPVNAARIGRQKHFAGQAEASIRRLQGLGAASPDIDPAIAAVALGSMIGRFAELWLIEEWDDYDFDHAVEQVTQLWANAIGLREPTKPKAAATRATKATKASATRTR